MAEPIFDQESQFNQIKQLLIEGETLSAVYDCKGAGTGFVGVTDQRVIFLDQQLLSKKRSLISIPYNRVIGMSSAEGGGMVFKTSEITLLTAAGNFSFEFRGADKAEWIYRYVMHQILNETSPQLRG